MVCSAPFITVHRVPRVLWGLWLEFLSSTTWQIYSFHNAVAHSASPQLSCASFVTVTSRVQKCQHRRWRSTINFEYLKVTHATSLSQVYLGASRQRPVVHIRGMSCLGHLDLCSSVEGVRMFAGELY